MYIPESYIVETGYSQGLDFLLTDSKQSYKGFYHKDKQGRYWTGKDHTNTSRLLTRVTADTDMDMNFLLKGNYISGRFTQRFSDIIEAPLLKGTIRIPNEADYVKGHYTRYIAQLNLSVKPYVIEILKDEFDVLTNNRLYLNYYSVAPVVWKLTGPINDIYKNNIRVMSGVRDTNLRSIQSAKKIIPDINIYLTDPLQYSRTTK